MHYLFLNLKRLEVLSLHTNATAKGLTLLLPLLMKQEWVAQGESLLLDQVVCVEALLRM